MNKSRRKELARAAELLQQALDILAAVKDDEREAFDNLPESLQSASRGEAMQEAADTLETIHDTVETTIGELNELVGA